MSIDNERKGGSMRAQAIKYFFLSLKHPAYHVGIALSVFMGLFIMMPELCSLKGLAISFTAAFALDVIDHPICIFLYGRRDRFARRVRRLIWRSPALAVRVYGKHHKRVEGLLLHSFPGLGLTWTVLIAVNLYTDWVLMKLAIAQVVAHQLFDVADDWAILGHVHNWELWRHRPRFSASLMTILMIVVASIILFGLFGGHFAHAGWSSFSLVTMLNLRVPGIGAAIISFVLLLLVRRLRRARPSTSKTEQTQS